MALWPSKGRHGLARLGLQIALPRKATIKPMFAVSSTLRSLAGRYVASVAEKNGMEMEGKEELMIDGRATERGREIPIFTADKGIKHKNFDWREEIRFSFPKIFLLAEIN